MKHIFSALSILIYAGFSGISQVPNYGIGDEVYECGLPSHEILTSIKSDFQVKRITYSFDGTPTIECSYEVVFKSDSIFCTKSKFRGKKLSYYTFTNDSRIVACDKNGFVHPAKTNKKSGVKISFEVNKLDSIKNTLKYRVQKGDTTVYWEHIETYRSGRLVTWKSVNRSQSSAIVRETNYKYPTKDSIEILSNGKITTIKYYFDKNGLITHSKSQVYLSEINESNLLSQDLITKYEYQNGICIKEEYWVGETLNQGIYIVKID